MPELMRSPIPLYFQISSQFEDQIESGVLAPGTKLPNEKQIARDYGVSIVTVRSAMRVMLDKKLVIRYPGKGTFIAEREAVRRVWAIGSLDDLVVTGHHSTMALLWRRKVFPPREMADKLGLSSRQRIYALRTVRATDSEPFMLTDTYHPPDIGNVLKKGDFSDLPARTKLVISIVEEKCGIKVQNVRQTMSIERASQDTARLLDVEPSEALLVVDRDYVTEDGRLVQTARARYRTDHYRYVINISHVAESETASNVYRMPPLKAVSSG